MDGFDMYGNFYEKPMQAPDAGLTPLELDDPAVIDALFGTSSSIEFEGFTLPVVAPAPIDNGTSANSPMVSQYHAGFFENHAGFPPNHLRYSQSHPENQNGFTQNPFWYNQSYQGNQGKPTTILPSDPHDASHGFDKGHPVVDLTPIEQAV